MKWKTPKRWWESDPLRVSAFHYPSCLSKALQTINLNHLLPSSTKPFLTYAHYILNPLPLIYPPRPLTPSNASVTRLCLVLPFPPLDVELGSVEAKSATGHLTLSCRWSMLLPEHLLRPFSNPKGAASFLYSAWHSKNKGQKTDSANT